MSKIIIKKDENKEEFFNQFLKNEIDKDVNLKEDIVTVVESVTKEDDICFLYDNIIVKKCKCCAILYHTFMSNSLYFCCIKELKFSKPMYFNKWLDNK
jgi:hypothetical protein